MTRCGKTDPFTTPLMAVYEMGKYIFGMNNKKSSGPDEISNQLFKPALLYIAGPPTYFFNLCVEQNVFPSEFQKAKVRISKSKSYSFTPKLEITKI